jgi:hypothetical protein
MNSRNSWTWSLLILVVAVLAVCDPLPASAQSQSVAQVWALEDDYWRYVETGDVERYETLWHEKFIGWPCWRQQPVRKANIGDWIREIRDQKLKVKTTLTRHGAEEFGSTVVVHYSFTRIDTYPDGRVKGEGDLSKITHTWMKVGNTWQIIGGMCGKLEPPAKP